MPRRSGVGLVATGVAVMCLGATLSGNAATYARFSDSGSVHAHAGAGVWAPDPPASCGPVSRYRGIVWGTVGDDVLVGGRHPQIIMGLDGDDVLEGGSSGDCLVGGPGDDRLIGGNSKDILIGGPGDDYLSGGNAKDDLDGSEDVDVCDGGNGQDTIVHCESGVSVHDPVPDTATGVGTATGQSPEAPAEVDHEPERPTGVRAAAEAQADPVTAGEAG